MRPLSSETLGLLVAALGTASVSALFAISEASAEHPSGRRSLFRLPIRARGLVDSSSGLFAILLAGALSLAVNLSTNLFLPASRDAVPSIPAALLFLLAVLLLPLSAALAERGASGRNSVLRLLVRRTGDGTPRRAGVAAFLLALATTGAAHTLFDVRVLAPASKPVPMTRKRPVGLDAARMQGVYVGVLDEETLVLFVDARGAPPGRVDCSLNARMRESISFQAGVDARLGLIAKVPGLEVAFTRPFEGQDGRLFLPLVDEKGKVRGELSEIDSGVESNGHKRPHERP